MFGMTEALLSFMRRQVGLRTDAANSAGSLHAKVAEGRNTIYNYLTNTLYPKIDTLLKKTPCFTAFRGRNSYNTWGTALYITGSGWLTGIAVAPLPYNNRRTYVRITIDGTVIYDGQAANCPLVIYDSNANGGAISISAFHRFNSSLRIETYDTVDGYVNATISYILD